MYSMMEFVLLLHNVCREIIVPQEPTLITLGSFLRRPIGDGKVGCWGWSSKNSGENYWAIVKLLKMVQIVRENSSMVKLAKPSS